jgi:hypothetical protein
LQLAVVIKTHCSAYSIENRQSTSNDTYYHLAINPCSLHFAGNIINQNPANARPACPQADTPVRK